MDKTKVKIKGGQTRIRTQQEGFCPQIITHPKVEKSTENREEKELKLYLLVIVW